jgi:hypothetical protein
MNSDVCLGEMLAFRNQSSARLEAWLACVNQELATGVGEAAALRGETLAQFIRISVSDFLAEADEESWVDLLSAIRAADDPGARCVEKMVAFPLRLERAP